MDVDHYFRETEQFLNTDNCQSLMKCHISDPCPPHLHPKEIIELHSEIFPAGIPGALPTQEESEITNH